MPPPPLSPVGEGTQCTVEGSTPRALLQWYGPVFHAIPSTTRPLVVCVALEQDRRPLSPHHTSPHTPYTPTTHLLQSASSHRPTQRATRRSRPQQSNPSFDIPLVGPLRPINRRPGTHIVVCPVAPPPCVLTSIEDVLVHAALHRSARACGTTCFACHL